MKRCSKCKQDQPRSEFHRHKKTKDGLGSWCKSCYRASYEATKEQRMARNRERYFADVDASRAASKAFREANKDRLVARARQLKYGVSAEQYVEMVTRAKGRCAVCGDPPREAQGLCIDHCHETGAVRGLLCGPCNRALGNLRDDPRIMRAAADYVEQHQRRLLPEGSPHDGLEGQDRCVGNSNSEEGEV